jgi:hypothetical protein
MEIEAWSKNALKKLEFAAIICLEIVVKIDIIKHLARSANVGRFKHKMLIFVHFYCTRL